MENVTIVEGRVNEIEFEINIQGANKKEPVVRFVVENKSIDYTMCAKHGEDDNWSVSVPIIPELKNKSYPFKIEIIVDGYFFEAFRGTVDIIAEPDVKTANIGAAHPAEPVVKGISVKKDEVKKPKKKVVKKKATKVKPKEKEVVAQTEKVAMAEPLPIEPIEEPIVEEPKADFKDMADAWLNREKPVVTEKDKTVKGIINNLSQEKPAVAEDVTVPVTVEDTTKADQASELREKDIKVRAILNATKW